MAIDLKDVVIKPTHHHLLPVLEQLRLTKDKPTFRFQLASLLFESVNTYLLDVDTTKVFQAYKTNRAVTLKQLQDLGITIGLDFINKPLLALLASSKVIQYTEGTLEDISPLALLEELLEPIDKELEYLIHQAQSDGNGSCIPTNAIVDRISIQAEFNHYKDIISEDLCKYLFGLKIDNRPKESYVVTSEVLGETLYLTIQGRECFVERNTGVSVELKVIHGSTTCFFTELADRDLFIGERILDLVERTAHYITSKLVELQQI